MPPLRRLLIDAALLVVLVFVLIVGPLALLVSLATGIAAAMRP